MKTLKFGTMCLVVTFAAALFSSCSQEEHNEMAFRSIYTKLQKVFSIYFCAFSLAFLLPLNATSQNRIVLDFIESFEENDNIGTSLPIINKAERLSSNSAIAFQIESNDNVPDSVIKCLEVASDIWRSCLKMNSKYAIRLNLAWEELSDDEDVKISVTYVADSIFENHTPSSLYYSLRPDLLNNSESPDAIITINKEKDWDCGYSLDNNIGVRNLNYVMLRSIAIALGFGSSLSVRNFSTGDVVRFPFSQGHSLFDNLLVSKNGIHLKDLQNTGRTQNAAIMNFCTGKSGTVYIDGMKSLANDSVYKIYTPSVYQKNKSLIYFDNNASLMHHSLDKSTKMLQIDSLTVNVLNKLGWDIKTSNTNFQIIGNNIPETGITSAYIPHSFYVEGEGQHNINNAKWSFYLTSSDGSEKLIKSTNSKLEFDIDAISEPDNYLINVNGDIYGKIIFTGTFNGNTVNLQYNVTFELKPSITNVNFVKLNNGLDSYDVACNVDYRGADYLYVTLEEEYGATLRSRFVREPYLAHFVYKNITSPFYAWIDIAVENKYGSDTYTIELPPYDNLSAKSSKTTNLYNRIKNDSYSKIEVFNISGLYIKAITKFSDTQTLPSGMYILKFYQNDNIVKTVKLAK